MQILPIPFPFRASKAIGPRYSGGSGVDGAGASGSPLRELGGGALAATTGGEQFDHDLHAMVDMLLEHGIDQKSLQNLLNKGGEGGATGGEFGSGGQGRGGEIGFGASGERGMGFAGGQGVGMDGIFGVGSGVGGQGGMRSGTGIGGMEGPGSGQGGLGGLGQGIGGGGGGSVGGGGSEVAGIAGKAGAGMAGLSGIAAAAAAAAAAKAAKAEKKNEEVNKEEEKKKEEEEAKPMDPKSALQKMLMARQGNPLGGLKKVEPKEPPTIAKEETKAPGKDEGAAEREGEKVIAKDHPRYKRWFMMLKAGVPLQAIMNKMGAEDPELDSKVLEKVRELANRVATE